MEKDLILAVALDREDGVSRCVRYAPLVVRVGISCSDRSIRLAGGLTLNPPSVKEVPCDGGPSWNCALPGSDTEMSWSLFSATGLWGI